jgi:hypothetical protein
VLPYSTAVKTFGAPVEEIRPTPLLTTGGFDWFLLDVSLFDQQLRVEN